MLQAQASPLAREALTRIAALYKIEAAIRGHDAEARRAKRQAETKALVDELHAWFLAQQRKLSTKSQLSSAIDYGLVRWQAFTRFLDDGRICMDNNCAERALRGIAVGRGNWLFAGSDSGAERAAIVYSVLETAALNGVNLQSYLADVLARIAAHPISRIEEFLPWRWSAADTPHTAAA